MKIVLKPIHQQVVVIFGASSGIGRLTAQRFAEQGAKVVVAARSEPGLRSVVNEIRDAGGQAISVRADAAALPWRGDSTTTPSGRILITGWCCTR